ncbi:hypothetical protein FNF27_02735 [Cafeteria roenbergensis]|uniref:Uncharacterized protein n=1 Tax=Cafeteria roenbergensis TaxID=33653 RepID=A0A5A8DE17_CAFRO|nr:hypothetical protein FNF29_03110 [Cafeteria roenbergensis]KAA0162410.1 hypothetical protein FNF31_03209 [Cafeteria roenbergensis]KAA0170429.1 hypothetical protein FNF28_01423 [Cafeteria roenbergensis]KAA0175653.1 hypothetical protein FNF27_02735 [Cafeteria roenbergensis]|eukprot:KAA0153296.1 hypothetical protein FNF29_03110 [Cafeteria roenbergensis]
MAASRNEGRVNPVKSIYGTLQPRAGDEAKADAYFVEPYKRVVGTFAVEHAAELREPAPPLEPEPEAAPPAVDPRDALERPAPTTASSMSELREAIRKHQAHAWDPEERFGAPQTTSMQVGWGAKAQPKETVRFPKVVSETTRTAELLFKSSRAGAGEI